MSRARRSASVAGFTIIEAMISMFFLTFIVGELAMVNTHAKRSSSYARRVTEASMIAEGILEKSRNTDYTNLNLRFSAANSPPNQIKFDLNRDGILESYSEDCPPNLPAGAPPSPPVPTGATSCGVSAGIYGIYRMIYPAYPAGSTLADSTGAAIDIHVRWYDIRNELQEIRVSTIRSKF